MKILLSIILLLPGISFAAPCAWWEDKPGLFGVLIHVKATPGERYELAWMCGQIVDAAGKPAVWGQWKTTLHCNEEEWSIGLLSRLAGRAETIRKAAATSPEAGVAAFHTAQTRYVTKPSARCEELLNTLKGK